MTLQDIKDDMKKNSAHETRVALQELHTYAGRELGWVLLSRGSIPGGQVWQRNFNAKMTAAIQECDRWQFTPDRKPLVEQAIEDAITIVKELGTVERDLQNQGVVAKSKLDAANIEKKELKRQKDALDRAIKDENTKLAQLYRLLCRIR